MRTDNNNTESLDHLPSPAELAEIYTQAEQNDPRSLLYKRTLVRPKLPVGWMLLFVLLTAGVCTLAYLGVDHLFHSTFLAILGCAATLLLILLVFAKQILIGTVKLYQALAPAKVRNRCRYEPSCSVYMIASVEKYGFRRGLQKGLRRWRGCKPPNGGYDLP